MSIKSDKQSWNVCKYLSTQIRIFKKILLSKEVNVLLIFNLDNSGEIVY